MDQIEEIVASIKTLTLEDRIKVKAALGKGLAMCSECWGEPDCNCCNDV